MVILLCEDDSDVRIILESLLTELGAAVHSVSNGLEALAIINAKEIEFDILITDFNMPRMNGDELVKTIIKKKVNFKKIIMISGRHENSREIENLVSQNPIISFLPKPLDIDKLIVKILFDS